MKNKRNDVKKWLKEAVKPLLKKTSKVVGLSLMMIMLAVPNISQAASLKGSVGVAKDNYLALRKDPYEPKKNPNANIIGTIMKGDKVTALGEVDANGWVRVQVSKDSKKANAAGKPGWVQKWKYNFKSATTSSSSQASKPSTSNTDPYKVLIASVTTSFKKGIDGRETNIRLSASKINNRVYKPGQTMYFGTTIGNSEGWLTSAAGYKEAAVFGGNGKGIGGGVCQTGSTLYNAALTANLQIVKSYAHSKVVSYVPKGLDAAYTKSGGKDLVIKNNKKYPIKIKAFVNENKLTVQIWSTHDVNYGRKYKPISRRVSSTMYRAYVEERDSKGNLLSTKLVRTSTYK